MRVLIVRPEPGNAATVAAVAAMGHEGLACPLFGTVARTWVPPDPQAFDAVAMTSAAAARLAGPGLARYHHLPLHAVGDATERAARAAGFADVRSADADAAQLSATLPGRVLHLAGADHVALTAAGAVTTVIVYESVALACPPDAFAPAPDVALVHSARAGARLADLAPDRSASAIVAISRAAAHACGTGWRAVAVADVPRESAMLATLAQLCDGDPIMASTVR